MRTRLDDELRLLDTRIFDAKGIGAVIDHPEELSNRPPPLVAVPELVGSTTGERHARGSVSAEGSPETSHVPTRKYQSPRVWEKQVTLARCRLRQLYILDLGHDQPTVLLTNDTRTPKSLITRYAQRMLIENAICDAVRFFHIDALSSAVAMKVDFDMTLLVIASGLYRRLAQRMRGYTECQARQIFRDLVDMPADVTITEGEVQVRFHRRAHLPIIAASGLLDQPVEVPWWNGLPLRMEV